MYLLIYCIKMYIIWQEWAEFILLFLTSSYYYLPEIPIWPFSPLPLLPPSSIYIFCSDTRPNSAICLFWNRCAFPTFQNVRRGSLWFRWLWVEAKLFFWYHCWPNSRSSTPVFKELFDILVGVGGKVLIFLQEMHNSRIICAKLYPYRYRQFPQNESPFLEEISIFWSRN